MSPLSRLKMAVVGDELGLWYDLNPGIGCMVAARDAMAGPVAHGHRNTLVHRLKRDPICVSENGEPGWAGSLELGHDD
jgi:hypothetical protein